MFGRKTSDIEQVLTAMHDQARVVCKHNQYAMAKQIAEWLRDDRRFDSIKNKEAFAAEAMDCRRSGRELDLTKRLRLDPTGGQTAGITSRW
jgi:hypothetical protein